MGNEAKGIKQGVTAAEAEAHRKGRAGGGRPSGAGRPASLEPAASRREVRKGLAEAAAGASPHLSSIAAVAAQLSISAWTVRDLIWSGALPYVRIGRRILVDDRDVDRFIESRKQGAV